MVTLATSAISLVIFAAVLNTEGFRTVPSVRVTTPSLLTDLTVPVVALVA